MKVFLITSKLSFKTGGGSIIEMDLTARELQRLGNDVTVITIFSQHNEILKPLPYKVIEEQIKSGKQLDILFGLLRILRKYSNKADAFHIDGFMLYGGGLYRRLGGKVPILCFINRELTAWPDETNSFFQNSAASSFLNGLKRKIRWYIERHIFIYFANGLDFATFENPFLEQKYVDFGLKLKSVGKTLIIGGPYPFSKVMKENGITEDSYRKRNKKTGKITLLFSGRMVAGKGFDFIITAFSKIKNKDNFRLVLTGSGPEENLVRQLIKDLNLDSYVELPGWISRAELNDILKKTDIFIQPLWRPFLSSLALSEAMAFGIPSIVPSGGGLAFVAGDSCLTFKPGNVDDLAAQLEKLGSDYDLRAELSHQCYIRLNKEDVSYEKTMPKISKILQDLAAKSKKKHL
ncbi:MAG: glycosyltransferase family 4 protein [bacterium]|nr:glycosyltransferase family 4 protein [bacterium]